MVPAKTKRASGHIILVQEQRFRLTTDSGQGFLLTLAHDAGIDANDLRRFHGTHAHVVVEYTGEPGLESGVAHAVRTA
jgi:hypothetical protein